MATDLTTVVQDALSDAYPWIKAKRLNVELALADDLPQVSAQPDCVYQMIINLLQNATRATPAGGSIGLRATVGEDDGGQRSHVLVSVQDQGGGIPRHFLGQVFDRFYTKDDRPIPGLGGQGPELSAVKTLVEAFGGRVWADSEPGVGSTLSLLLPAVAGR